LLSGSGFAVSLKCSQSTRSKRWNRCRSSSPCRGHRTTPMRPAFLAHAQRRNGVDAVCLAARAGARWRHCPRCRQSPSPLSAGVSPQSVSLTRRKSRPSWGWARAWRRWLCLCCRRVAVATVAAVVSSCTGYERGVTCHTGVSVRACCPFASVAAGVLARCRRLSSPHMSTHEMRHATRVESAKRRDTHVHCVLCCASHRTARRSARQCDAPFTFTSEVCASGHRFVW
jgi:hypothetical protein